MGCSVLLGRLGLERLIIMVADCSDSITTHMKVGGFFVARNKYTVCPVLGQFLTTIEVGSSLTSQICASIVTTDCRSSEIHLHCQF